MGTRFGFTTGHRLLACDHHRFDISVLELFGPLLGGATVVIVADTTARYAPDLVRTLEASQATFMQATPTLWQELLATTPQQLPPVQVLIGGEALPAALATSLAITGEVTNLYGPTETTIWSTATTLTGNDLTAPPIGRPIDNTQLYILDPTLSPVPAGIAGELYIAGDGLARGYLIGLG